MSKCLGGYQLIDLKGLEISAVDTVPDQKAWEYAIQLKKPVIIHNYVDKSNHFDGPVLLAYNTDSKVFIATTFDFTDSTVQASIFVHNKEGGVWKIGVQEVA